MMRLGTLFEIVIKEMDLALTLNIRKPQLSRYRDLLFGIILNLTCNLENEKLIEYMVVELDVMRLLKKIVVDVRQDWPTNGGALALLQFCHLALSNHNIYEKVEENSVRELLESFSKKCRKIETKKYLFEAI